MSNINLPGDKEWPVRKADNLTAICEVIVYKMWELQHLTTLWASTACYRDSFAFYLIYVKKLYSNEVHIFYTCIFGYSV
jgi:hypothetical protein